VEFDGVCQRAIFRLGLSPVCHPFVTRLSPVFCVPGLPLRRLDFVSTVGVMSMLGIKLEGPYQYLFAGDVGMAHDGGPLEGYYNDGKVK